MAYKFSLGASVLSGSVTFKEGLSANDASISNVNDIAVDTISADGSEIDIVLADNQAAALEIKEGSNVYMKFVTTNDSEAVEVMKNIDIGANDLTINKDKIKIGGSAVTTTAAELNHLDGIADAAYNKAADSVVFFDADDSKLKYEAANDFAGAIAGDGLAASSGALAVQVSGALKVASDKVGISGSFAGVGLEAGANEGIDSMLTMNIDLTNVSALGGTGLHQTQDHFMFSDNGAIKKITFSNLQDAIFADVSGDATIAAGGALTIGAQAVENSMLADDAVGADELAANAVVDASVASNAAISLSKINTNVDMGGNFTIGNQSDDTATFSGHLTVGGNLTVQGSTTTVDSTTINISSSFTFEGPADDHETILSCATPGADTTLNLPTLSAGTYFLPALADAATDASAAVTAAEFALLDGGSSVGSTALAAADGFLHNDNGTMKHTSIEKLGDFLGGGAGLAVSSGVLSVDIDGLSALGGTGIAQGDHLMFSDDGTEKKITFSNLEDAIFGNISGDATIAAGGALTIAADAVESGMLNDNVISGQTELASGAVVDADEMMISDGGTLKKVGVDSLKSYMQGSNVQLIDDSGTAVVGFNYFGDHSGAESCTLPASPAVGDIVYIKAGSDCSSTNKVTINKAGSQTIDGVTAIILESPFAAVNICYVADNTWRVF